MLHEVAPGKRVNRYVELSQLAFGNSRLIAIKIPKQWLHHEKSYEHTLLTSPIV